MTSQRTRARRWKGCAQQGITDVRVLEPMGAVPRTCREEAFASRGL